MTDSLNIFELLDHLRTRWRFIAAVVVAALIVAGAGCLLAPRRYTATATVVIDPPGGGDPRTASSVSPIYLESLKSYEQFASSDTLFLKACLKFGLLDESSGTTIERFKRRVLRVEKLKDTRLLEISATLPEARRAQELAQYIAEETVALSRDLSRDGDLKLIESLSGQLEPVRLTLDRARTEAAGLSSRLGPMEEESRYLTELLVRTRQQLVEATAEASDLAAQEAALSRAGPDRDERASTELAYVRQRAAGSPGSPGRPRSQPRRSRARGGGEGCGCGGVASAPGDRRRGSIQRGIQIQGTSSQGDRTHRVSRAAYRATPDCRSGDRSAAAELPGYSADPRGGVEPQLYRGVRFGELAVWHVAQARAARARRAEGGPWRRPVKV